MGRERESNAHKAGGGQITERDYTGTTNFALYMAMAMPILGENKERRKVALAGENKIAQPRGTGSENQL